MKPFVQNNLFNITHQPTKHVFVTIAIANQKKGSELTFLFYISHYPNYTLISYIYQLLWEHTSLNVN